MSENILKALMQLFAIIARVDSQSDSGRIIVQTFLRQQLNHQLAEQYLIIFDEFIKSSQQTTKKRDGTAKRRSSNSVKVLKICSEINNELTQAQKIVVLIRLIEFVSSNEDISDEEVDFISTVSESFNIQSNEFNNCMEFVLNKNHKDINSPNILILGSEEGISGHVRILWVQSVNLYAMLYYGNDELQLNGHFVAQGKVFILTPGSSFKSSKTKPIYYSDILSTFLSDTLKEKLSFEVKDLEYHFKGGKKGLHQLSFGEESGKLIGIMGGSGAGKSTLLNILNGNETPSNGSVKINGINIHTEKEKLEGVIGFISQDDLLIEELTVFENLFYNAKLCFGDKSDEEISIIVSHLLNNIGLAETKNLKVGSPLEKTISGGQRKRLNIALELVREPSVLFVDEPTSGLSSRDSDNIMDLLKELALKGKLVFVVIHQPSSDIFKLFDDLIVLDKGGYPIYYGNPIDAVVYFKTVANQANSAEIECAECGNVNPEQIFNIIDSKVLDEFGNLTENRKISPQEWNIFYKEKVEPNIRPLPSTHTKIPESGLKVPGKFKQFKIFLTRDILSKLTNKQYLIINLLEAPLLAFILAYFSRYYKLGEEYIFRENENIPVYLFMSIIVSIFIGLTVSAEEIIRDRKILKRESFLNLNRGSYLWSKISIMFMWSAIQSFLYVMIGNTVLEVHGMTLSFWFLLFTTSCFANLLGLNISSGFNSVVNIYILIPFLIVPQLLFSGAIVNFDKLNPTVSSPKEVPVIGDIMVSRWALEAIVVKQFKDNLYSKNIYPYDKEMSTAKFKQDYWLSELQKKLNFVNDNYKNTKAKDDINKALTLIKSELVKELNYLNVDLTPYSYLNDISSANYNASTGSEINELFSHLKRHYIKTYNNFRTEKDKVLAIITSDKEKKEDFLTLKNDYDNESVTNLVTNKNSFEKIEEYNGELIQKSDPIYQDPKSSSGRAHMFAPRKNLLNTYYDTFTFNISIIWIMSAMLIITLYFDVLRRLLNIELVNKVK